jgi:hypothetical protein
MVICTGVLPWIVLDLLQWKTQCRLFTYIRSGFVNHYFPVESQTLYLSIPGFVNVQNWKNSVKKLNITIMFPFCNLFKVDYNTCKLVKKKNCLKWIKIVKKLNNFTVKIFYMWMLCITLKKKIQNGQDFFYRTCNVFFYLLCSWIIAKFKECLIKSRNSHCLYAHQLYFNAWKLFQLW